MKIKNLIALALALLVCFATFAQQPKREMRSVWIAAMGIDWPRGSAQGTTAYTQAAAKEQMTEFLDNFKAHNFTSVCVHVRPLADALYKSSYEPWSASVSGTRGVDPGWDPLEWVVEECHKRGLECYAWINPFRIDHHGKVYNTPQDLEWREKGWELKSGDWTIFNPAIPEARQHCLNVMKEVYMNYDIDGMLFDDYFYPGDGTPTNSSAGDWQQYQDYKTANNSTIGIADWRRMNVNTFVKEIYDMIQADRPDMRFGISPAGVGGKSAHLYGLEGPSKGSDWMYDKIYCDPLAWLNDGSIDFISPQIYWARSNSSAPFSPLNEWWSDMAKHFGRHYYASLASYKVYTSEFGGNNADGGWSELDIQVRECRQRTPNNAPGQIYYNASALDGPDYNGLGDYLEAHSYNTAALIPVVDWKERVAYPAPAEASFDGTTLSWKAAEASDKAIIRYTVYAVPYTHALEDAMAADGDGLDIKYLADVSYSTSYTLPEALRSNHWYAVCVYDGYGFESEAALINYTGERSGKPEIIAPKGEETITWETVFEWTAVNNATYSVEISLEEDFSYIVAESKNIAQNSATFDLSQLRDNTLCYWRVIAGEPNKIATASETATFRSPIRTQPAAPQLLEPTDGATIEEGEISFSWETVKYADTYRISISRPDGAHVFSASISAPSTSFVLNSNILGVGDFKWEISAFGSRILGNTSEAGNFTINEAPIGTYEPGYTIAKDPAKYAEGENLMLENLWMRKGLGNAMNIGMTATADYVYISGRSADNKDADIYLSQYSAKTGEHIRDIALSDNGKVASLPCNDVIKDSKGNICIVNQVTNGGSRPIVIQTVDFATGELTDIASLKANKQAVKRIDHAAIYGDVKSGEFTVFAAVASKGIVVRWIVVPETETQVDVITLKTFSPADANNFGAAPRIVAVDENRFYIDGGNTIPALYNFESETLVSTFTTNPAAQAQNGTDDNGMTFFTMRDKNYFAYNLRPAKENAQFAIAEFATEHDINSLTTLWAFPADGLGSVNSETASAPIDVVVTSDRTATIYVYSPCNGLAAYRLTDTEGASITDIETDNNLPAEYFNLQGIRVEGELTPGLYISRQGSKASKIVIR